MSIQAIVQAGRIQAEILMTDHCTIVEVTGQVTDHLTGQVTDRTETRYSGRCRIQQPKGVGLKTEAGAVTLTVLRLELQLPVVGTELVDRGHQVTIDASSGDPALVGRLFRIRDLAHKSHATSRRLTLEEIT